MAGPHEVAASPFLRVCATIKINGSLVHWNIAEIINNVVDSSSQALKISGVGTSLGHFTAIGGRKGCF